MIVCSFSKVGRAIAPAVAAIYNGESAESPKSEQNSRVKVCATSPQAVGEVAAVPDHQPGAVGAVFGVEPQVRGHDGDDDDAGAEEVVGGGD